MMRRKICHAFLMVPVLFVLLHSVTPHQHSSFEGDRSFTAKQQCPIAFLSQVFQIDLGENHLEDFEISRYSIDLSIDNTFLITFGGLDLILIEEDLEAYFIPQSLIFQNPYLKGSRSLRAPPHA